MQRNDMEAIKKFIANNPQLGRRELSKQLDITEYMARTLKKEIHPELFNDSKISDKQVASYLKARGLSIDSVMNILQPKKHIPQDIGDNKINEFVIGVIGDTHLCDNACAIDELHDFYNRCRDEGVRDIVHAGDITAGMQVYRGMEFDLIAHGLDCQIKYVEENYPELDGITTHVISGNHDLSFKQNAGANFVEALSMRRNDIHWVGDYDANIKINGVSIGLHHGAGSSTVQISYKIQKYIDRIGGGNKPQIYVLGHYHSTMALFYRNIHCYMPGCFQKPNDFSVRLGLPNLIGGYIVHIKTLDDEHNSIRSIKSELISYY